MRIIVPMAGMGKRMRPHTLTVPKPLIPIAGKPIVQRLVEDIAKVCQEPIEEVAFIIGHFGEQVEKDLKSIAESVGAKGSIYYQEEALGTAHAIMCAQDSLDGKVVVAFADTLFKADFQLDTNADGTIWVQRVEDPRPFGVVKLNENNEITDFVEKPEHFVSDLAIIGIYYFRDGNNLRNELQYLLDNDIRDKGEYQLTNALENMKNKGIKFIPAVISEWLDCGNKNATVYTNQRYLEYIKENKDLVASSAKIENSVIIPPVYIGENAQISNSVIGPHVSVGNNTSVQDSVISNSIVQQNSVIKNGNISNSMLGNFVSYEGSRKDLSLGDYNTLTDKKYMITFRNIVIATCCFTVLAFTDSAAQSSKKKKSQPAQETETIVEQQSAPTEQEQQISENLFLDGVKYYMLEDYKQALQLFQKALTLTPNNAAINYKIAETQLALKNPQAALPFAEAAISRESKNAYYYLLLAQLYTEQRQFNEAALTYNNLLKNVPDSDQYLFQLADLYLTQSNYADALKTYERIEKHFGPMEQITINRQQIYLRQKNVAKAVEEGEKLIASDPTEVRYYLAQAELYNASKMPDKGIETLQKALRIEPNNPFAHLMLSDLHRQKGNKQESEKQVKLAFASPDLDIDTKVRILVDFIRQLPNKEIEGISLELVDLTIQSHPEEAKAYAVAADLQAIVGEKVAARNNYLKAVVYDDSHFKIWQQIVLLDAELAQADSLVIHSEKALTLFPNQAIFWFYNGTGHLIVKDFAKAIKSLEYGKRLSMSEPTLVAQFNMQLGDAYNSVKEYVKSDEAYEQVLAFDANNDHVLNNYSYFLSLRNHNLKKAKEMSGKLVSLHPNNPTYLDTHAWVLYKAGDYEGALKYLEQAIALSDDATIVEHYGDVLFKLGKKDAALKQWQRAKQKGEASAFLDRKIRDKKLYE